MSTSALRVYIACAYSEIDTARKTSSRLSDLGMRVVSSWHDRAAKVEKILSAKDRETLWEQNAKDMELCQALFCPTLVGYPRSTFAEFGHVLALGEPLIVVEPRDHRELPLVCYAPRVRRVKSIDEGIAALVSIHG